MNECTLCAADWLQLGKQKRFLFGGGIGIVNHARKINLNYEVLALGIVSIEKQPMNK